jgi:hypothetical protein
MKSSAEVAGDDLVAPLLKTKLEAPGCPRLVARENLIEALSQGLSLPLTLVYGCEPEPRLVVLPVSRSLPSGSRTDPMGRPAAGRTQPAVMAAAARFSISSDGTSSTWVATFQRWPKGSSNWPERSP